MTLIIVGYVVGFALLFVARYVNANESRKADAERIVNVMRSEADGWDLLVYKAKRRELSRDCEAILANDAKRKASAKRKATIDLDFAVGRALAAALCGYPHGASLATCIGYAMGRMVAGERALYAA